LLDQSEDHQYRLYNSHQIDHFQPTMTGIDITSPLALGEAFSPRVSHQKDAIDALSQAWLAAGFGLGPAALLPTTRLGRHELVYRKPGSCIL
jgi:hypothetical protein